jgi:hypothetical protein
MRTRQKAILAVASCLFVASGLQAQQPPARENAESVQLNQSSFADLSPENREIFNALRDAGQQGRDADVLKNGRLLLSSLKLGTPLANFVLEVTAGGAIETGDLTYALALLKPYTDAHPRYWHAAALLARTYAESGDQALRDQETAHLLELHKQTSDPNFTDKHIFPIQKVPLHSGYAIFLYPFEPLKPYNTYLIALIYSSDDKQVDRIELGSENADQAFFKPKKPGERRFSIDTYHETKADGSNTESQALNGFVDGTFDYDRMRDLIVKVANGEPLPHD